MSRFMVELDYTDLYLLMKCLLNTKNELEKYNQTTPVIITEDVRNKIRLIEELHTKLDNAVNKRGVK